MEATASARYLRGSAQKARLVVDMIRGKDVNQALAILRFSTEARGQRYREVHAFGDCQRQRSCGEGKHLDRSGRSVGQDGICRSWANEEPPSCQTGAAGTCLS